MWILFVALIGVDPGPQTTQPLEEFKDVDACIERAVEYGYPELTAEYYNWKTLSGDDQKYYLICWSPVEEV